MSEPIYLLVTFSLLLCNAQSGDPKYYAFRSVPYAEPAITGEDEYMETKDRRFKVCGKAFFTICFINGFNWYYLKAPEPLARTWDFNLQVQNVQQSCLESTYIQLTVQPTV